jgi:hypothetical protein
MLSWVVFDCRYKLEQVGSSWNKLVQAGKSKIEEKEVLDMIQAPRLDVQAPISFSSRLY